MLGSFYTDKDGENQDSWFQSNIGTEYRPRRVFAISRIDKFQLVKPWKPLQWNSLCVIHNRNHFSLSLNNHHLLSQVYKKNGSTSWPYDVTIGPFYGAIADLQIWKRSFTKQEITDFNECQMNSGGDFYQWDPPDFTLQNMVIDELAGEEYCPKPPKAVIIATGKLRQFHETVDFCADVFRGRMAVAKDLVSLRAMNQAVNASSCAVKSYFYIGHIYDGNGRFSDFYDQQPLNFRIVEINLNDPPSKKDNEKLSAKQLFIKCFTDKACTKLL